MRKRTQCQSVRSIFSMLTFETLLYQKNIDHFLSYLVDRNYNVRVRRRCIFPTLKSSVPNNRTTAGTRNDSHDTSLYVCHHSSERCCHLSDSQHFQVHVSEHDGQVASVINVKDIDNTSELALSHCSATFERTDNKYLVVISRGPFIANALYQGTIHCKVI